MKRLTKAYAKELLKEAHYMDALAYLLERIAKYNTYEARIREWERLYSKMMEWANEFTDEQDWEDDGYEDFTENYMRIDSALYIAIDSEG